MVEMSALESSNSLLLRNHIILHYQTWRSVLVFSPIHDFLHELAIDAALDFRHSFHMLVVQILLLL